MIFALAIEARMVYEGGNQQGSMRLKVFFTAILLSLSLLSSHAITIGDLEGAYVGKWTQETIDGVLRYDAVVVYEADGRVSTYLRLEGSSNYGLHGVATYPIAEDGSFAIGSGEGIGQVTLNGRHLEVAVVWSFGATVEFQGHLSERIRGWVPPTPEEPSGGLQAANAPFGPAE
jgi:hypothetical protein